MADERKDNKTGGDMSPFWHKVRKAMNELTRPSPPGGFDYFSGQAPLPRGEAPAWAQYPKGKSDRRLIEPSPPMDYYNLNMESPTALEDLRRGQPPRYSKSGPTDKIPPPYGVQQGPQYGHGRGSGVAQTTSSPAPGPSETTMKEPGKKGDVYARRTAQASAGAPPVRQDAFRAPENERISQMLATDPRILKEINQIKGGGQNPDYFDQVNKVLTANNRQPLIETIRGMSQQYWDPRTRQEYNTPQEAVVGERGRPTFKSGQEMTKEEMKERSKQYEADLRASTEIKKQAMAGRSLAEIEKLKLKTGAKIDAKKEYDLLSSAKNDLLSERAVYDEMGEINPELTMQKLKEDAKNGNKRALRIIRAIEKINTRAGKLIGEDSEDFNWRDDLK